MGEEKVQAVLQWLIKARNDLRSAQRLFTANPPLLDTAAYHCQQAAEKALKGYLTLHESPFRKNHLLAPLLAECEAYDSGFGALAEAGEALTPFATTFRYSGDVLEPEQADVAEAIQLAAAVFSFVLERLPEEVSRGVPTCPD
ncbi:MAG: HEPN domain-containing protein [Chromatiaceae bacterium]|nr:HEPN domain-containing protein [Chromatiaceae bacterium]